MMVDSLPRTPCSQDPEARRPRAPDGPWEGLLSCNPPRLPLCRPSLRSTVRACGWSRGPRPAPGRRVTRMHTIGSEAIAALSESHSHPSLGSRRSPRARPWLAPAASTWSVHQESELDQSMPLMMTSPAELHFRRFIDEPHLNFDLAE